MVVLLQHIVDEAEIILRVSILRVARTLDFRVRVELFVSGRYGWLAHWTFMVVLLQHIVDEAEITL